MSIVPFVAAGLLLVLGFLSLQRIAALPLSAGRRLFLGTLRMALAAAVAAAFFEPVLTFDRIPPRQPVPVIVDVSQSMRLFSPGETIIPVLKRLQAWNAAHADPGHRFAFYRFGDSLRPLPSEAAFDFSDRRSFLPAASNDAALKRAVAIFIISDGNWSNATMPLAGYADKTAWYLPLPGVNPAPFLRMEVTALPPASPADSPLAATITLDGFSAASGGETLSVSAVENGVTIAARTASVTHGPFRLDIILPLPHQVPGRRLYRFVAATAAGTRCSRYALHTALPAHFTWAATLSAPSLDERFIRLALGRDRDFQESAQPPRQGTDLAVLFDAGGQLTSAPAGLKPAGDILIIGSFPGAAPEVPAGGPVTFMGPAADLGNNPLVGLDLTRLPPPDCFYRTPGQRIGFAAAALSAGIGNRSGMATDTIPVLYSAEFAGRHALVCAASGIWRWDFAPLALADEEAAFAFSRRLVAWVKDRLTAGLSNRLFLYPAGPLSEVDSIPLRVLFPADLAIPSGVGLSCRFASDRLTFDTTFTMTAAGGSYQSIHVKPLPEGRYKFEVRGKTGGRTFSFADSLFVDPDQSEFSVTQQNTSLLSEIAQPLTSVTDSSIAASFFGTAQAGVERVRETLPIQRNWGLLMVILGLLTVEWVARRMMRLD